MSVIEGLFWILAFLLLYPYFIYPILLYIVSVIRSQPIFEGSDLPNLSLIIPAYNEEKVIVEKLQNALNIDYPQELMEIIVVSDASTDRTDDLVSSFKEKGVKLIVNQKRRGKTYGLNRAYKVARGEILVFTDANSIFETQALRMMVKNFCDPKVGLVTGSTRYYSRGKDQNIILTLGFYTRFERWIKELESRAFSCVGADGAIFGLKRRLYRPLAETEINDFVIPLDVVRQGYRTIFKPEVYCLEEHSINESEEFWRQVRIITRTIRSIMTHRDLLNPFRYRLFAWMLWSHKVLRFLFPCLGIFLAVVNLILVFFPWSTYKFTFTAIIVLFILSVLSKKCELTSLSLLRSFFYMNQAILVAWRKVIQNQAIITWEKDNKDQA